MRSVHTLFQCSEIRPIPALKVPENPIVKTFASVNPRRIDIDDAHAATASRKKTRSRKGSGSVFQQSDGRWVARTPPVDGVRRKFVRKTKAEARAALNAAFAEGLGKLGATSTISLGTYAKRW